MQIGSPPLLSSPVHGDNDITAQYQGYQYGKQALLVRCCDPFNQKVYDVPASLVEETMGKHTYWGNPSGRRAQICMKYQDGQCNMKARCQQIHADRAWVAELRSRFYDSRKVYVSDIVAIDPETGGAIAFKYSEVDSCQAKDVYRTLPNSQRGGFMLCTEYLVGNTCSKGRSCQQLHVSAEKYQKALHVEGKLRSPPASPMQSVGGGGKSFPTSPMSQYCIPPHPTNTYTYMNCPMNTGGWCPASPTSDHLPPTDYLYYNTQDYITPVSPVSSGYGCNTSMLCEPDITFDIPQALCETVPITLDPAPTRGRGQSASSTPNSRSRSAPPPEGAVVLEEVLQEDTAEAALLRPRRSSGGRSRSLMAHGGRD